MDCKEEHLEGAMKLEELPQMDGTCDACEPDEAQVATQMCHTCSFAFCSLHADRHVSSTHHPLTPYKQKIGEDMTDHESKSPILQQGAELGAEGSNDGQNGMAAAEAGKRDTVSVVRLRCKEHEQEGSLYCKQDEKIICVVCAMQGEHQGHEIITLYEAYIWQKNRHGLDLLECTRQMEERISNKANSEMSAVEMEAYVSSQFAALRKMVTLEEKRSLHLLDLREAFLTASAAEKIAEINVQTERLQEEMASITHQLCLLDQGKISQALAVGGLIEASRPGHRLTHDLEARPRVPLPRADPVDPRKFEDSGPSMEHAP